MSEPITIPFWVFLGLCAFTGIGLSDVVIQIQRWLRP